MLLPDESQQTFDELAASLSVEHQPSGPTEGLLVERMAQHFWLSQRAVRLQGACFKDAEVDQRGLSLYLRYQTTNDRAFHKCLADLLKLRAEKQKQENGFVSQKQTAAAETRKQELHEARVRALDAKSADQEINTQIRTSIEAPLPGHTRIPFDVLRGLFTDTVREAQKEFETMGEAKAAKLLGRK